MARQRNPETIAKIADAAWQLFGERGYYATSYADVAAASGINRATVQHYFPKKEIMASINLKRLRTCAVKSAQAYDPKAKGSFAELYILGQIYIASLMSCENARRFFCDVLENRILTDETISTDFQWSIAYVLGTDAVQSDDDTNAANATHQDIVVNMGGLYELMFHCIRHNTTFNIAARLEPVFQSFAHLAGVTKKECTEVFKQHTIPDQDLIRLGKSTYNHSFKEPISL